MANPVTPTSKRSLFASPLAMACLSVVIFFVLVKAGVRALEARSP
jgi:hypothetical protein